MCGEPLRINSTESIQCALLDLPGSIERDDPARLGGLCHASERQNGSGQNLK